MGQDHSSSKPPNPKAPIGQEVHCRNCGTRFLPNVTIGTINEHMNSCFGPEISHPIPLAHLSQGSGQVTGAFGNQISGFQNNSPQGASIKKPNQSGSKPEKHIWKKIKKGENEFEWQKTKAISEIDKGNVIHMKPHEIRAKSFEEKLVWFRHQVEKKRISWKKGADFLKIRREFILGDSMESLATVNLFKEVKIVFDGEQVQDAGGLIREWAGLIAKEMFSRETGYFVVADTKNLRYKINPNKEPTPELIKKYRFFGKFVGKAVFERIPLNLYFDRCLIKHMIDACIVLDDIKYIDEDVLLFFP